MGSTVYAIAFRDGKFLMVYHPRRGGWEMPGGKIENGETPEEAAVREFREESGYNINIIGTRDLGHCFVCSASLGEKVSATCEMESRLFDSLPEDLSFERDEYEDTVPWARSLIE